MTAVSIATCAEPQELDVIASSIRTHQNALQGHACGILNEVFAMGADLLKAKALVPKGRWEAWLDQNCALSDRQAQRYMRLANHRDLLEPRLVNNPELSLRAADQLIAAAPKNPAAGGSAPKAPRVALPQSSKLNILEHWERSLESEQRAVLAAMPREKLLAILPDGIGVVPASVEPKNGFAALPLPDGDDGLGIPDFLRRPLIIATH
jgi:hypothetical protein